MTRLRRLALAFVAFAIVCRFVAIAQDDAADVRLVVGLLRIHAGSVVADVGAGRAALTAPIAAVVGPSGRVFATELPGGPLARLRAIVDDEHLVNVVAIAGAPAAANLPAGCCDAIVMRNVYHHFADPASMDASLLLALKPGGRLAVLDFAPNGREAPSPAERANGKTHGVTERTVTRELQQSGFEPVSSQRRDDRTFVVVVRRPEGD